MFPDSPYAGPTGTFKKPVLPPTVDPGASPTRTFTISCQWLPYIRGALQQLLLQSTWDVPDEAGLILAQARAWTLISMFDECTSFVPPFACPYDWSGATSEGWLLDDVFGTIGYSPSSIGFFAGFGLGYGASTASNSGTTIMGAFVDHVIDPTTVINYVDFHYSLTKGSFPRHDFTSGIQLLDNSGGVLDQAIEAAHLVGDTSNGVFAYSNPAGINGVYSIRIGVMNDEVALGATPGGNCELLSSQIRGSGPAPC